MFSTRLSSSIKGRQSRVTPVRARQFRSTMPVWERRLEAKKSSHLPYPALLTRTLISGLFSFKSCSNLSMLSSLDRSKEMAAMVLSGCASAISRRSSFRRATSQKASTLGYWAMMASMYSFPSPLEAPVITAVTIFFAILSEV